MKKKGSKTKTTTHQFRTYPVTVRGQRLNHEMTPKQRRQSAALIRKECCNYDTGECIALDEGDGCACVLCGAPFIPKSNRAKYCPSCAIRTHRRQKAECERKRRACMDN